MLVLELFRSDRDYIYRIQRYFFLILLFKFSLVNLLTL